MPKTAICSLDREAVKTKYADIMTATRPPAPAKHSRMPLRDRAKLFSPYAALRSFNEKIANARDEHNS